MEFVGERKWNSYSHPPLPSLTTITIPIPILKLLFPFPFKSKYQFPLPLVPFSKKNRLNVLFTDDLLTKYRIVLHSFTLQEMSLQIPGSWFILRQRRIGRHDSSTSSCPSQPLQPHPTWCPFSWDLSWRRLSSSVAVDLASSWNPRVPIRELVAEVYGDPFVKDVQAISDVCIW